MMHRHTTQHIRANHWCQAQMVDVMGVETEGVIPQLWNRDGGEGDGDGDGR